MSKEFSVYKQNLINNVTKKYNNQVTILTQNYNKSYKSILNSFVRLNVKKQQLNALTAQYNVKLQALKNGLNATINQINALKLPTIQITSNKSGLMIGLNYIGTENELYGCINDATNMCQFVKNIGFNNVLLLTDNTPVKPTKNNIINQLTSLLKNTKSGDFVIMTYSGHGSYQRDTNRDEVTGYDQMIVPLDLNCIVDDELKKIIDNNLANGATFMAIFDSCFSQSVLDLKYQYYDSLYNNNYSENNAETETKGNVICISGCSDIQTSADALINGINQGALTWAFLQTHKKNITWRNLILGMRQILSDNQFTQIPQLSSGKFLDIDSVTPF